MVGWSTSCPGSLSSVRVIFDFGSCRVCYRSTEVLTDINHFRYN